MKTMLLAVFCLLRLSFLSGQNNINISNYSFLDTEPTLAVNPANPGNIVAAWMRATAANQITIAWASSQDGGTTWTSPMLMPHLWSSFTHADVSLSFNSAGTGFISYIDYKMNMDSGYVMVASSANGGISWSTPVKAIRYSDAADKPIDRPWMAVDRSGGPFDGRLYVTGKSPEGVPLPHHIWIKSSSDGGLNWSAIKQLDDSIPTDLVTNSMAVPAVGKDGSVYITYASYHPAMSVYARMICLKSTNGGMHFTASVIGNYAGNSAVTDTLYQPSYVISADPTNSNHLQYAGTDARNGDPDIFSCKSLDGGFTWSPPIRVNDDAVGNGVGQDMCWAGFSANGVYMVAWRDRRNGGITSKSNFELYASGSLDNGFSFSPNINLSKAQSPSINLRKGNDFIGVALSGTHVYVDWSDLRTGNTEIFTSGFLLTNLVQSVPLTRQQLLNLSCYPNPTTGALTIQLTLQKECKVRLQLFDMTGKLARNLPACIGTEGVNEIYANIHDLPSGQYVLKVWEEGTESEIVFEKRE
jgi:hypothetical protein